jgi:hypothetical protein
MRSWKFDRGVNKYAFKGLFSGLFRVKSNLISQNRRRRGRRRNVEPLSFHSLHRCASVVLLTLLTEIVSKVLAGEG